MEHARFCVQTDGPTPLQPGYAGAYNNREYAYYWQGQYPNAIADYDRAIALRPTYPYAYNNRRAAYMASGDSERTILDFDRALQQQPDLLQAYTNRGNAYLRLGAPRSGAGRFSPRRERPIRLAYRRLSRAFTAGGSADPAPLDISG